MPISPQPKRLSDLIQTVPGIVQPPAGDAAITGIALDSRQVQPGNLFVALTGGSTDGHLFINNAIYRGASSVVGTLPFTSFPVPYLQVEESRLALAHLSAAFFAFPARKLTMLGVTGTDGKTTTTNLLYSVLKAAGIAVGMVSTVNAVIGDTVLDTGFHVTTPEAPDVQRYLAEMVSAGLTHAVIETTSHGLAQHRVAACDFDIAVVTNITHEHLDYHGSYEAYRDAKARLFTSIASSHSKPFNPPRGAVLNRDDISYPYLSAVTVAPQVSYGLDEQADVRAGQVERTPDGLRFTAYITKENALLTFPVQTFLEGAYNVSNCLAAIAAASVFLELPAEAIQEGIASLRYVPGRFEKIDLGQDFTAIVDFAHTPNALRVALESAREIASKQNGRVIAIFGAAGLRDRQKRRMMAEVSAGLADFTVLTAEDPRTESLDAILAEMATGASAKGAEEGETFWRVPDRGESIRFAISLARPGDVVIVCGKGHEQSMCFGDVEYAWDDRIAMRAALAGLLGVPGPEMPTLPTSH